MLRYDFIRKSEIKGLLITEISLLAMAFIYLYFYRMYEGDFSLKAFTITDFNKEALFLSLIIGIVFFLYLVFSINHIGTYERINEDFKFIEILYRYRNSLKMILTFFNYLMLDIFIFELIISKAFNFILLIITFIMFFLKIYFIYLIELKICKSSKVIADNKEYVITREAHYNFFVYSFRKSGSPFKVKPYSLNDDLYINSIKFLT